MNEIYIDEKGDLSKVAYFEGERLIDLYIEPSKDKSLVGNIYRGRVVDIVKGMNAAFIDIGEEKNAYLSMKDALPKELLYNKNDYKISELLKQGSEIIVQVLRDSYNDKGAKVTCHIELGGKYLILTPFSSRVNISRKIKNKSIRDKLKANGIGFMLDGYGMIIRTSAQEVDRRIIEKEYLYLCSRYEKIKNEINFLPCPDLIYKNLNQWEGKIRDKKISRIITNTKKSSSNITSIVKQFDLESIEVFYDEEFSFSQNILISRELKIARSRTVYLERGGSIVIDEAEALIAIDVNTKSYTGKLSLEDTVFQTNLEAAREIARQIRIRNLAGIIIIDFIRMDDQAKVDSVIGELRKSISEDSIQTNIHGMTNLGLLEVTRKKTRPSLSEILRANS